MVSKTMISDDGLFWRSIISMITTTTLVAVAMTVLAMSV